MAYIGPLPIKVPTGGTGDASLTAYAPLCGGVTTTSAVQSASVGLGTSGFVLTSNGSAALPTFQATAVVPFSIVIQKFTTSGTYIPTTGVLYATMECWGGGGGGGGAQQNGGVNFNGGGGGGAGAYSRTTSSAATIGASQVVTVGAAGAASGLGANPGGNGGTTSVGTLCVAPGGSGGAGAVGGANANGGAGGVVGTGDIAGAGEPGSNGYSTAVVTTITAIPGNGGSTSIGGGGLGAQAPNSTGGSPFGFGSGSGGAQAFSIQQTSASAAPGFVIITEYL